jgi:hypothetical protein
MAFRFIKHLKNNWVIRRAPKPNDLSNVNNYDDYVFIRVENLRTGKCEMAHIVLHDYGDISSYREPEYADYIEYLSYENDRYDCDNYDPHFSPNYVRTEVQRMANELCILHFKELKREALDKSRSRPHNKKTRKAR